MGSFLCKTEENVWLFIPLSHREGPKEKHCSSEDVQSAFIFSVEDSLSVRNNLTPDDKES